jgi:CheY-like chemotaxis protein
MEMPHILVAEDDPDTRELVEIVLRRADFRVTVTDDPFMVVELLATCRFDALLLDNLMPKMNGIELCRVIRSVNQEILIFFCSGAVAESDKEAAFAAGAQGYITKPFEPHKLAGILRDALAIGA